MGITKGLGFGIRGSQNECCSREECRSTPTAQAAYHKQASWRLLMQPSKVLLSDECSLSIISFLPPLQIMAVLITTITLMNIITVVTVIPPLLLLLLI